MSRILIGSPIRQTPPILHEFLTSLLELEHGETQVDYAFVDDNHDPRSRDMLQGFQPPGQVSLLPGLSGQPAYNKTEHTHFWNESLVWRVAAYKDRIIDIARENGYDGLFFVDSDLVLHPRTLGQLLAANVDIIAEVFWTRWEPGLPEMPQVWVEDHYTQFRRRRGESLTPQDVQVRQLAFWNELRQPGVYEVGGLGACTLLSRRALLQGVSFREVYNLSWWGEDRHFCIRAAALGLRLYVDTHYPAYHIYRDTDLAGVAAYKADRRLQAERVEALDRARRTG